MDAIVLNKDKKTIEFVGKIYLEDFLAYIDAVFEKDDDISEYHFTNWLDDGEFDN